MAVAKWMIGAGAAGTLGAAGAMFGMGTPVPAPETGSIADRPAETPAAVQSVAALDALPVAMSGMPDRGTADGADASIQFCLEDTFALGKCVSKGQLLRQEDRPTDRRMPDGQPRFVQLAMVHPDDFSVPEERVSTCAQYAELRAQGWGAMTTADMHDEQHYLRYCGLVSVARTATKARSSGFREAGLTKELLEAIPAADWPVFGEGSIEQPVITAGQADGRVFDADTGRLVMRVSDVSEADFDGDGEAERLVYLAARARGGTAGFAQFALVEMTGQGPRLRPIDWR
jgi:hypothetical protein